MLTFEAIGTAWKIKAADFDISSKKQELLSIVDAFERDYSRFTKNSYIGRLNSGEALQNPPAELVEMLCFAEKAHRTTSGAFNIFIGATLENNGYGLEDNNSYTVDFTSALSFTAEQAKINGQHSIDLGGFGKGWLIDKISTWLKDCSDDFVVNGGGDIYVQGKATIAIESYGCDVAIRNQAIASSRAMNRSWIFKGKHHSHIPDARQELEISVIANTAKVADMVATTGLIVDEHQLADLEDEYTAKILLVASGQVVYCSETEFFNVNV